MTSLPVVLRIERWPCVVVGGGRVASRKTRALLDAGALVTVIAPTEPGDYQFVCTFPGHSSLMQGTFKVVQ